MTLTHSAGRVIHKNKSLVLAIIAVRLVAGYAQPPAVIMQIVQFAFTVAVVLQGAIWVREIVLGLIQRRAAEGHNETLSNAMGIIRSEEHTSELQSLMRTSYAVLCLKKKTTRTKTCNHTTKHTTTY